MSIDILYATADIVSSYVTRHEVPTRELPGIIASVRSTLERFTDAPDAATAQVPAVPVRKSITPEYLICLEDGRKLKTMRRHLGKLNLTPDEYRKKWGLPDDYPMVAPNYTVQRSELAKKNGLGTRRWPRASFRRERT